MVVVCVERRLVYFLFLHVLRYFFSEAGLKRSSYGIHVVVVFTRINLMKVFVRMCQMLQTAT